MVEGVVWVASDPPPLPLRPLAVQVFQTFHGRADHLPADPHCSCQGVPLHHTEASVPRQEAEGEAALDVGPVEGHHDWGANTESPQLPQKVKPLLALAVDGVGVLPEGQLGVYDGAQVPVAVHPPHTLTADHYPPRWGWVTPKINDQFFRLPDV